MLRAYRCHHYPEIIEEMITKKSVMKVVNTHTLGATQAHTVVAAPCGMFLSVNSGVKNEMSEDSRHKLVLMTPG
jgi:hypothetical protein